MARKKAAKKHLPQRLSREEAAALLGVPNRRAPTGIRNRALLRIYYRGGLRCSEALALTPRDINFARKEIRVNAGKGDKDRVVWMDDQTIEILDRWKQIRPPSSFFFCTLAGGGIDTGYVRAMVARYGRRAGIEVRVHPHMLRHSFATEMIEEGRPTVAVQKLLGHEDLATTELYLHLADADLKRAMTERPE